jgi:integrase
MTQRCGFAVHNFHKTTATVLDGDDFTAREIADQLGHSRPSMT